jgi:hypothetical protein
MMGLPVVLFAEAGQWATDFNQTVLEKPRHNLEVLS